MLVPDKSWMILIRDSKEFRRLTSFVKYAVENAKGVYPYGKLSCLCTQCTNKKIIPIFELRMHVIMKGWFPHYVNWILHGEPYRSSKNSSKSIRVPNGEVDMCDLVHNTMDRH